MAGGSLWAANVLIFALWYNVLIFALWYNVLIFALWYWELDRGGPATGATRCGH